MLLMYFCDQPLLQVTVLSDHLYEIQLESFLSQHCIYELDQNFVL